MKFSRLDLVIIKACLVYTQDNSDTLSFLDIIKKLDIVINDLEKKRQKGGCSKICVILFF